LRDHHIVRTAWVCGARGSNFVRTMLRVGREQGAARVVDDQIGSPTFTRDLAAAIRELAVSGRYGTWHRTNSGTCSWYELAAATFELAGIDVDLERMSSDELDRPAARPAYSVLSDQHATLAGLTPLPHWRDGLRPCSTNSGNSHDAASFEGGGMTLPSLPDHDHGEGRLMQGLDFSTVAVLLAAVTFATVGQLLLKAGMTEIGEIAGIGVGDLFGLIRSILTTWQALLGLAMFGASSLFWLVTLSRVPLSTAYPVVSLSYLIILAFSYLVLDERPPALTWGGAALIVTGIVMIGFGGFDRG
jgi:multidrug transporter EmrE-like cation transporter